MKRYIPTIFCYDKDNKIVVEVEVSTVKLTSSEIAETFNYDDYLREYAALAAEHGLSPVTRLLVSWKESNESSSGQDVHQFPIEPA